MQPDTTLEEAIGNYINHSGRINSAKTAVQYQAIGRKFSRFLGREALIADLRDDQVGAFFSARRQDSAADTVRGEAAKLLALWRWLARKGVATAPEIQTPRCGKRTPRALTRDEMRRLWRSARKLDAAVGGVPARLYWPAFLGLAWDSGERVGAIHALTPADIDLASRTVYYKAANRKGGLQDARKRFTRRTRNDLRLLMEASPRRMFAVVRLGAIYHHWHVLREDAGLPVVVTPHAIRRSHATYLKLSGGDARASLGHTSDAVTNTHYIDPTLGLERQPCDLLPDPSGRWRLWLAKLLGVA